MTCTANVNKRNSLLVMSVWLLSLGVLFQCGVDAFTPVTSQMQKHALLFVTKNDSPSLMKMVADKEDDALSGVVELSDDDDEEEKAPSQPAVVAPFLSQGELAEDVLNPDLSDPKQTRVIIYIIISLIPVLFLVPLMLGSRDLIPLDALPPVEM